MITSWTLTWIFAGRICLMKYKTDFLKHPKLLVVLPFAFVLLNTLIKGLFLPSTSIAGDEPFSIYHAQMDVFSIVRLLSSGNNPPLYEIILHYWISIFGISEWAVRLPSLIFSSITAYYIYKIGIKYLTPEIALTACVLFVFSNYQILYAHQARGYTLFGMLTTMSLYYYIQFINQKAEPFKYSWLFIIINVLLIYTHYFGIIVLGIEITFILFNPHLRQLLLRKMLFVFGIIAICYLPMLYTMFIRFTDSVTNGTWIQAPDGFNSLFGMVKTFTNMPVVAAISILFFIIAIIKFFILKEKANLINKLLTYWFVVGFFGMFFISYAVPVFLDRYLMFAAIPFVLLLSAVANNLINGRVMALLPPIIICILFIATTSLNITNKRNVRETVQYVESLKQDSTMVIISPKHFVLNFAYYYDKRVFKNINTKEIYKNIQADFTKNHIYTTNAISELDYKDYNHIVFLNAGADFSFPDNNIEKELSQQYSDTSTQKFYEIFIVKEFVKK